MVATLMRRWICCTAARETGSPPIPPRPVSGHPGDPYHVLAGVAAVVSDQQFLEAMGHWLVGGHPVSPMAV